MRAVFWKYISFSSSATTRNSMKFGHGYSLQLSSGGAFGGLSKGYGQHPRLAYRVTCLRYNKTSALCTDVTPAFRYPLFISYTFCARHRARNLGLAQTDTPIAKKFASLWKLSAYRISIWAQASVRLRHATTSSLNVRGGLPIIHHNELSICPYSHQWPTLIWTTVLSWINI